MAQLISLLYILLSTYQLDHQAIDQSVQLHPAVVKLHVSEFETFYFLDHKPL